MNKVTDALIAQNINKTTRSVQGYKKSNPELYNIIKLGTFCNLNGLTFDKLIHMIMHEKENFTHLNTQIIMRLTRKLHEFKRKSLIHLYFLLRKNIKNADELFNAIDNNRYKKNIFQQYILFEIDEFDNANFAGYSKDLKKDIDEYLTAEDLDFIFSNREEMISLLVKIAEEKR